jgi:hypothetical protein
MPRTPKLHPLHLHSMNPPAQPQATQPALKINSKSLSYVSLPKKRPTTLHLCHTNHHNITTIYHHASPQNLEKPAKNTIPPHQFFPPETVEKFSPKRPKNLPPSHKSPTPSPAQKSPQPSKLNPCVESLVILAPSPSSPSSLKVFAASNTAATTPPASP